MFTFTYIITVLLMVVVGAITTKCDSSYYEKYYAARRLSASKQRTSLVAVDFTLELGSEKLKDFEQVALVGDLQHLGSWRADQAVLLERTPAYNVWKGSVQLPANSSVNYRYFIAAIDKNTRAVQVRRWESHLHARSFSLTTVPTNRTDTFGYIESGRREVQRGWLNSGRIVQFKLFRNPLHLEESLEVADQQVRLKVQPVDPDLRSPILPSARAHTEYVRFEYGNSFLRDQPEFGVPYNEDGIIIFHTSVSELGRVSYMLYVYAVDTENDVARLLAYQYIDPYVLRGSEGSFNVTLLSPIWLNVVGVLELQYLVMAPLVANSTVDFRTSFVDYWRPNWQGLHAGHRGLGKSLKVSSNAAPLIENTVASMKAAALLGADAVEFDVQLTRDLVPIIYHDYSIYVCMHPKKPSSKDDLSVVLIKDVTYEQLKNLKTYQVVGSKIIEYPAHNSVEVKNNRLFPTFEDFLTKINKSIGFDIEIKWPQPMRDGEPESVQTIDKNLYVDRILEVMLRHGCGRLSFFTSFDADICSLLRFKQNMYPVMFLSSGKDAYYLDPRSDTIYDSVNTAQAFDLLGIVPEAVWIKDDPSWIQVAVKQEKKVFLWGSDLKDRPSIKWFLQQGATGVIYDRMDLYLPKNKTNIFAAEPDLPQFFQLQCPLEPEGSEGGNHTPERVLSNVDLL